MYSVCLVGLAAAGYSGVPRYAAALTAALDRVSGEFPDLRLRLLSTAAGAVQAGAQRLDVELVGGPFRAAHAGPRRIVAEQLAARRARADLLHFFDLAGPVLGPRRRFVTTVHDAAIRHGFERARVAHKQVLQPWAIRRAAAIVAVSAFAAEEAVSKFGADPQRVHVIRSGPGLVAPQDGAAGGDHVAERGSAVDPHQGPYVLYVGNISAHKNLPFLVDAFTAANVDARLLLVGRRGERFEQVQAAIDRCPAPEKIELHRDAPDELLDRLYRSASALLLPSRYEGFGFTALEAMARACPVLASDIPAVREISGDGAWLLPLDDQDAWAGAIAQVLNDQQLGAALRSRGEHAVSRYSWDTTARNLCTLFLRVAETSA